MKEDKKLTIEEIIKEKDYKTYQKLKEMGSNKKTKQKA